MHTRALPDSSSPYQALYHTHPRLHFPEGYKCLNSEGCIYISKDVTYDEFPFPYPTLFSTCPDPSVSPQTQTSSDGQIIPTFNNPTDNISPPTHSFPLPLQSPSSQIQNLPPPSLSPSTSPSPDPDQPSPHLTSTKPTSLEPTLQISKPLPANQPANKTHHMVTCSQTGSLKPNVFLAHTKPTNIKQALASPKWKQAMQAEYQTLLNNNTWILTSYPSHSKATGCKWVFRVKENPDDSINKYKARLVAKCFNQLPGQDHGKTYCFLFILHVIVYLITT